MPDTLRQNLNLRIRMAHMINVITTSNVTLALDYVMMIVFEFSLYKFHDNQIYESSINSTNQPKPKLHHQEFVLI